MGGNVASLDGANAQTINFREACFWTGMAASKRQAVGIQEICRVSVQAVRRVNARSASIAKTGLTTILRTSVSVTHHHDHATVSASIIRRRNGSSSIVTYRTAQAARINHRSALT
jgi:hypothetical protein